MMKIAIPVVDGRLLGHLGEARQFALVEVNPQDRSVVRSHIVEAPQHEPGLFPRWLHDQGVQMLITAGAGQRALDNLNHHHIKVLIGQTGAPMKTLVAAWLAGQLNEMPNGCDHQSGKELEHECRLSGYLAGQSPET